jgi:hypothetical protein
MLKFPTESYIFLDRSLLVWTVGKLSWGLIVLRITGYTACVLIYVSGSRIFTTHTSTKFLLTVGLTKVIFVT